MKWGDAARPAALTLLTVLIFTVSFRDAFPLETMTRAEKERACWDLLTALATQVEPKKQLRAAMDSPMRGWFARRLTYRRRAHTLIRWRPPKDISTAGAYCLQRLFYSRSTTVKSYMR